MPPLNDTLSRKKSASPFIRSHHTRFPPPHPTPLGPTRHHKGNSRLTQYHLYPQNQEKKEQKTLCAFGNNCFGNRKKRGYVGSIRICRFELAYNHRDKEFLALATLFF